MRRTVVLAGTLLALAAGPAWAQGTAPGAPGADAVWTPADKAGFGTAASTRSKVWHTLENGELTEVYYPDLGTPAVRDLQLIVSDGRTFAVRETDATSHRTELLDRRSLSYRQVNTDPEGRFRVTKTYATDPRTNALLIRIRLESLTGRPLQAYVLHDPALSNDGGDDSGSVARGALLTQDAKAGGALVGPFSKVSNGYLGTSDGWQDLRTDFDMDASYASAPDGNVVQTARTRLTGLRGHRTATIALGFGGDARAALGAARDSLGRGFRRVAERYADGWHGYLRSLNGVPSSARDHATTYDVSAMTLAAHEDKTYRGAYVASPSMPWVWGQGLSNPSDAYHLVWARDLYQIATGLLAAGDRRGANRSVDYLFKRQQEDDGSFPQNSTVDGEPKWTNEQLDETALPIVLAWQLGRRDVYPQVKRAADFLVANGPDSPQERWENQGGWSPATIAAEIAGLVCAADMARRAGERENAEAWLKTADEWQSKVEGWTATPNGRYEPKPYYLRLTKDGHPELGTTYDLGDSGPEDMDQRVVVDPSFLELVRLGVKPADDPVIRNTVQVVDEQLGVDTPNGTFWHRYTGDGYGEKADGSNWDIGQDPGATTGRIWPIFAGERGEYELLAGGPAGSRLASMAGSANDGFMIPEQVWDENPPSGQPGFATGEGTFSATPLAWSHAQFLRLAWSLEKGRPVEQPRIVARRYAEER